ncbi:unnamed protein product, partial [Musa acuminata subsp. burmannicoides]
MRSKQPAASLSLMRSKQPAASAPRPHAQPARCLGSSASCAANTLLPRPHAQQRATANMLPRPLGLMRSKQLAASAPRPHAQPARCLGSSASCAANTLLPRPHAQQATRCLGSSASCAASSPLPRLLSLMRSKQPAASAPRP